MALRFRVRDHLRPADKTLYAVECCAVCGYGRVDGAFTPAEVSAFYAEGYYTHEEPSPVTGAVQLLDRARMHLAWRRDRGQDLSPDEVARTSEHPVLCDVGCGAGPALKLFRQSGYEVVGVEPDAAARKVASAHGEVFAGTAEALPDDVAGRQFDVVLLSHVLEHCIDPLTALANVKRLLKPDGTLIVEVPNNAAKGFALYGPGWFFTDVPRHLHFFTPASLGKALALTGLKLERTFYTGYTRQFGQEWLAAQQKIHRAAGIEGWNPSPWTLLAKTVFAPDAEKYNSIRVHCVHA
jgi:2-polyprenyl-3-methyl-5-hydroxy-6-metoxy-1,4-benzoquinol methylase